jgi:hypothetical protein
MKKPQSVTRAFKMGAALKNARVAQDNEVCGKRLLKTARGDTENFRH